MGARLKHMSTKMIAGEVLIRDADENVRIARERYRVGAGTVNELLDAQAALKRAGAVRAQAEWDHRTARATYEWTIGRAEPAGAGSAGGGL
jgi:outer membrane protein TolC